MCDGRGRVSPHRFLGEEWMVTRTVGQTLRIHPWRLLLCGFGRLTAMFTPVVILNWNGWEDTFVCLRSLRKAADVNEVWLVDNGSNIDRSGEARDIYPGLRVFSWDENYGWAGGNNRVLAIAVREGRDFVYLLNNDCTVPSGFLFSVEGVAMSDTCIAAVGSRIEHGESRGYVRFDGNYHEPGVRPLTPESGSRAVPVLNGAGMLVRLRAMQQHGYFDERFFCYHEEAEWCRRVIAHGWSCRIACDSIVTHKNEGSNHDANSLYYKTRNRFLLLLLEHCAAQAAGDRCKLIAATITMGEEMRRQSRLREWTAIACALHDGLRGRFGPRQRRSPVAEAAVRLEWRIRCACLPLRKRRCDQEPSRAPDRAK
jgi:GT2 family glycosyltransferase